MTSTAMCTVPHTVDPDRPRRATHGQLCTGHYHRLEQTLAEYPALVTQVEQLLATDTSNAGPKVTGTKTQPLPYDEHAADALRNTRDILASWSKLVVDELNITPPALTIQSLSRFLLTHLNWIVQQDITPAFYDETHQTRTLLTRRIFQNHASRVEIAACTEDSHCDITTRRHIPCQGILLAAGHQHDELLPLVITCPRCGRVYEPIEWRALAKKIVGEPDPYITAPQLSRLLDGTPVSTLHRWAGRDEWRRLDTIDSHGKTTRFHLDDAQASYENRRPKETPNAATQ